LRGFPIRRTLSPPVPVKTNVGTEPSETALGPEVGLRGWAFAVSRISTARELGCGLMAMPLCGRDLCPGSCVSPSVMGMRPDRARSHEPLASGRAPPRIPTLDSPVRGRRRPLRVSIFRNAGAFPRRETVHVDRHQSAPRQARCT
jgi:hypothetical protein